MGAQPLPGTSERHTFKAATSTAVGPAGTVVVVAHSNTLRSLMSYFDEVGAEEVRHDVL